MPESIDWNYVFMIRLALAGILGAAIGFERECRAKEAGTRTHFLVAIGSCLMMIVSQWGFGDHFGSADPTGVIRYDVSRVAAQIVSGIGFIGAGTIMMQKQVVHGADHRRGTVGCRRHRHGHRRRSLLGRDHGHGLFSDRT